MLRNKAFTLMELIVVMVIVGILAAIALPSYLTSIQQSHAQDAEHNLLAIYAAEVNYYNNNTAYITDCNSAGDNTSCINTNLGLSVLNNGFDYACGDNGGAGFKCTANSPDVQLAITDGTVNLTDGSNPTCTPAKYCP